MAADTTVLQDDNRATLNRLLGEIWPDDPERRLLAAVVASAVRDVMRGSPAAGVKAMHYINGANFESDCEWLELDPQRVRDLLKKYENDMNQLIPPETLVALHAEYMDGGTLKDLAQANGVSAATLSRLFSRAGLPTRPRRGRKAKQPMIVDATPLQVIPEESPAGTIRDLHAMLKDFKGQTRGSVQIQVKFNLEVQL